MMVMTETNFTEFITFINTHPKWRHKLVRALFPNLDVAKAFRDMAESQQQIQQTLQKLTNRVDNLEAKVDNLEVKVDNLEVKVDNLEAKVDNLEVKVNNLEVKVDNLEAKVDKGFAETEVALAELKENDRQAAAERAEMKRDIANIKGVNYESRIVQHANAIFGLFIRRGHDARNEIGLLLEEAEDNGVISEQEQEHVYALDLLWAGKQKDTKADVVLAIEISWRAEETDIERAVARANILRKIGLTTIPVVAGMEWDEAVTNLAHQHKVIIVTEKKIDKPSWYNAN
jgi:outer membrane murein-binding lipoprotein Lpp